MNKFIFMKIIVFNLFIQVIDRLQTTGEVAELKKEIADLNAHNHQVESTIDEIYLEKQR